MNGFITEEDFREACNDYLGWCTTYNNFTRPMTETDAEGYDCPECNNDTVVGAENALIMGLIAFK